MRSELGRIWPTAKSAGVIGAPHGANYDAYATLTGPTLRANLPPPKGGSDDPLRGSLARTIKLEYFLPRGYKGGKIFDFLVEKKRHKKKKNGSCKYFKKNFQKVRCT